MNSKCPNCSAAVAASSRFCWRCGTDVLKGDRERKSQYAVHPGESVFSFNLVTSLMPHASGDAPQAFRFALLAAIGAPILLAALGFIAIALAAAAVAVPVLYLFYFYDANEWEDQPGIVVGLVIALSALLGVVSNQLQETIVKAEGRGAFDTYSYDPSTLTSSIVGALLVVILAQIGPVLLSRRPAFDDLIDGLTFGVAAGSSFAAGATLAHSWKYVATADLRVADADTVRWITSILELGLLKPLIFGAAVGLVVAAFSGIGEGPGRFSPSYLKALLTSIVVVFVWLAVNGAIDGLSNGSARLIAGLAWSLVVAGYLTLRLRVVLHVALVEAAAEAAARGSSLGSANKGIGYCPECAIPLVDGANFCSSCGTSVRAHARTARKDIVNQRSAS